MDKADLTRFVESLVRRRDAGEELAPAEAVAAAKLVRVGWDIEEALDEAQESRAS